MDALRSFISALFVRNWPMVGNAILSAMLNRHVGHVCAEFGDTGWSPTLPSSKKKPTTEVDVCEGLQCTDAHRRCLQRLNENTGGFFLLPKTGAAERACRGDVV